VPPPDTTQLLSSGTTQRVLRNDISRLSLILAGMVSKYTNERARAILTYQGFLPWGDAIGSILNAFQQGDSIRQVGAPITSVLWTAGPSPRTVIKTGYA
jgi:hypothetical protein